MIVFLKNEEGDVQKADIRSSLYNELQSKGYVVYKKDNLFDANINNVSAPIGNFVDLLPQNLSRDTLCIQNHGADIVCIFVGDDEPSEGKSIKVGQLQMLTIPFVNRIRVSTITGASAASNVFVGAVQTRFA